MISNDIQNPNHLPRQHTKIARLIALLCEGTGASVEDMTEATGWRHTRCERR